MSPALRVENHFRSQSSGCPSPSPGTPGESAGDITHMTYLSRYFKNVKTQAPVFDVRCDPAAPERDRASLSKEKPNGWCMS